MGFNSMQERKPFERASSINHSQIMQNEFVINFLENCDLPKYDLENINYPKGNPINKNEAKKIRNIITIDGGYSETFINKGFPSTSLAFFNFGALLINAEDLESLDKANIINPEDLKRLKEINKISLAIPAKNVLIKGSSDFSEGVRKIIYEFFTSSHSSAVSNETLMDVLEWLMLEKWEGTKNIIPIDFCPNKDCNSKKTIFNEGEDKVICSECGKEIYLTDYFRFHELINEPNGASGIFGYLSSLIEQVLMVQIIKYIYDNNKTYLSNVLFIKDGPLAFFGQTFRLHIPMRNLINHLFGVQGSNENLINMVGLEKSGPFVEHAFFIKEKLERNHYYILTDEYIRKYIVPQNTSTVYGDNTYYGWKIIYKTSASDVLVLSIPVNVYNGNPSKDNFANIDRVLGVLDKMRCNMYENSIVPLALINKLVSISEYPSSNILEKFIKHNIS